MAYSLRAARGLGFRYLHHSQRRHCVVVALHIGDERGFEHGISQFVHPQGAEQGIAAHLLDQILAPADQACLWAAEQFVATVGDHVNPGPQTVEDAWLILDSNLRQVEQRPAAQVFHQREMVFAGHRRQFFNRWLLGKPGDLKV